MIFVETHTKKNKNKDLIGKMPNDYRLFYRPNIIKNYQVIKNMVKRLYETDNNFKLEEM
jgi:hypothetical protein